MDADWRKSADRANVFSEHVMSMKVTVEVTCSACHKKLDAVADSFRRSRRFGERIQFSKLFTVEKGNDSVTITRGVVIFTGDDDTNTLCCSAKCAVQLAANMLPKLKPTVS